MASIFINYRSGDVPFAAAMLAAELTERFGQSQVFLDSRSIEPGSYFDLALLDGVRHSTVLLVLVGPQWTSPESLLMLRDADDWVRREILLAWQQDVPVVPLLVERTERIDAALLPAELRDLARLQYLTLSSYHAHRDINDLVTRLVDLQPDLLQLQRSRPDPEGSMSRKDTSRKDLGDLLRRILPAAQQWSGNRQLLTEVALSLLRSDDQLEYLAPCQLSRAIPGSAVVLVTRLFLMGADIGERGRVSGLVRVPRSNVSSTALLRRRRLGVATADVDIHTEEGDVITVAGLLRSQGEELTDILRDSSDRQRSVGLVPEFSARHEAL
ncbi:MAG: toll/interleukin-1 receptor domain-containing protein [Pseudonocardiaceae bacterium]